MQTKRVVLLVACGLLTAASSRADDEDFSQGDARSAVTAYIDARVRKDGTFRYVAKQKGTYTYLCTFHPNMKGKLEVK